jgi:hypothetical protein
MVRPSYEWNRFQSTELGGGAAKLNQLFVQTKFSGNLGGRPQLASDWIIDWKRFYDFREVGAELGYGPKLPEPNMAGRIDTIFDLHLDQITGFNHHDLPEEKKSITVRNLLRGFALGLACGEDVARWMEEEALTRAEVTSGPHAALLDAPALKGKTPLWFYVLKEAREKGSEGRLGRVGSRIVAETLIGLIRNSKHSILRDADWRPAYGRAVPAPESVQFEMVDLLHAADVVDPIGKHMKKIYGH